MPPNIHHLEIPCQAYFGGKMFAAACLKGPAWVAIIAPLGYKPWRLRSTISGHGGVIMDQSLLSIVETVLRVGLGLRFLNSGMSNVFRWPNAVKNAQIVFRGFPQAAVTFFAAGAVALMVFGAVGLTLGFLTQIAALCIIIFLIPTFKIHRHWTRELPRIVERAKNAIEEKEAKEGFQLISKQAMHSHETGWMDNAILLLAALYFLVRGSVAFGLDNLFR